jgi:hypothetical protein
LLFNDNTIGLQNNTKSVADNSKLQLEENKIHMDMNMGFDKLPKSHGNMVYNIYMADNIHDYTPVVDNIVAGYNHYYCEWNSPPVQKLPKVNLL